MFGSRNRKETAACNRPLPSLGDMDYETIMRFLDVAEERAKKAGVSFQIYLEWAIHVLLASMSSDCASRIFLPKTETGPFEPEDLFPFSAVPPDDRKIVSIARSYVIAPIWHNAMSYQAVEELTARQFTEADAGDEVMGEYISDLNLAVVTADPHEIYFSRFWGHGAALLNVHTLDSLEQVVSTDGENWYVKEADGSETYCQVLEPRMAVLYTLALRKAALGQRKPPVLKNSLTVLSSK